MTFPTTLFALSFSMNFCTASIDFLSTALKASATFLRTLLTAPFTALRSKPSATSSQSPMPRASSRRMRSPEEDVRNSGLPMSSRITLRLLPQYGLPASSVTAPPSERMKSSNTRLNFFVCAPHPNARVFAAVLPIDPVTPLSPSSPLLHKFAYIYRSAARQGA